MGPFYDHQVGRWTPPDDINVYIRRGRRAQAQAMVSMLRALFRGIAKITRHAQGRVRGAAKGASRSRARTAVGLHRRA